MRIFRQGAGQTHKPDPQGLPAKLARRAPQTRNPAEAESPASPQPREPAQTLIQLLINLPDNIPALLDPSSISLDVILDRPLSSYQETHLRHPQQLLPVGLVPSRIQLKVRIDKRN